MVWIRVGPPSTPGRSPPGLLPVPNPTPLPLASWLRGLAAPFAGWTGSSGPKGRRGKLDPRRGFTPVSGVGPGMTAWTDSRIDQVRAFRHWTYVAVSLIAKRVACQFPNIGRVAALADAGTDPKAWVRHLPTRQKALTPLFGHEDLVPVDHDHPLIRLFSDPNDPDTSFDLWYETVMFLELTGSAYWWVPRDKVLKQPAAAWVLPSHWVWPRFSAQGDLVSYDLRPDTGNLLSRSFPAEEVVHFRWKSPISKWDGYSPQTAGAQWIDTQLAIDRSRWYTFRNGAFPAAALEFDPQYFDPQPEDLDRIEAKFMARYAGETRAGKPLLLPPGVKFHKLSLMPREMDYQESAEQMRDHILGLFHVPAVSGGIVKGVTGQVVLAAEQTLCTNCLNPLARMLGQTLTEHAKGWYADPAVRVWWNDTTPTDPAVVEKQIQNDVDSMAISPNEIRLLRGRQPYPYGGDDPFMPHVGLVMPWASGQDANAVNPFGPQPGKAGEKPGRPPKDGTQDDPKADPE